MHPTALLLALSCASFVSANGINVVRGVMAPQITQGLPLFAAMKARQVETCDKATETPCPDGDGCCPSGAACGYTTYQGQEYGICEGYCKAGVATCTTPITACCEDVGETCGYDGTCTAAGATLGSNTYNTYASATESDYTPALTTGTATRTASGLGSFSTTDDSGFSSTTSSHTTSRKTSTTSSHTSSTSAAQTSSSGSTGAAPKSVNIIDTNVLLLLPILGFAWEARQWLAIF